MNTHSQRHEFDCCTEVKQHLAPAMLGCESVWVAMAKQVTWRQVLAELYQVCWYSPFE